METVTDMLHMCNDIFQACDKESPCPSYPDDMETWMDDFSDYFADHFPPDEIELVRLAPSMRFIQSIFRAFMAKETSGEWASRPVAERLAHVDRLAATNQVAQRTPEWYSQSKLMLTASEFSNILGTPRAMATLALKKVTQTTMNTKTPACCTPEMGPFDWGIRFEPVVKQVLERMGGVQILEMGRFIHPENARLAASPDGIIVAADDAARIGRLLEIKCPITRKIDGTIPHDYWCQMQVQMEVTDIDECEYVEMSFESGYKEHSYTEEGACAANVYDTEAAKPLYCGHVWLLQEPESLELRYVYTEAEKDGLVQDGWWLQETIPWHVKSLFQTVVIRNRQWYQGTLPAQEEFWKRMEDARAGLIEPPKKRAEKVVVQVCKIYDEVPPVAPTQIVGGV